MSETKLLNPEFERKPNREIERKYLPLFPEQLRHFRELAFPIEQITLSHPSEPYGLRMREITTDKGVTYTAALKSKERPRVDGALDRLEVETEINPDTYRFYKTPATPILRKLRAKPFLAIDIDFFEDGYIQAESEEPIAWRAFLNRHGMENQFVEVTGDRQADNEWRSHMLYRKNNQGVEALKPLEEFDIDSVARDVIIHRQKSPQTLVRIIGRSGSGKSTAVTQLAYTLASVGIETTVLSTDDYNRGKTDIERSWGDSLSWDDPEVYNTAELSRDITRLRQGETIERRAFDFQEQEPVINGVIRSAPVIIIEGIYAGSPDLDEHGGLAYEIPTPLATCIGRRITRDFDGSRVNNSFPTPEKALRYLLEVAEPAYRRQMR